MADTTKRQGSSGKAPVSASKAAALPAVSGSATMSSDHVLSAALGMSIRVQTIFPGHVCEGELHSADKDTGMLCVVSQGNSHFIPFSSIGDFTITGKSLSRPPAPPPIDNAANLARADEAVVRAIADAEKFNRNVPRDVQNLFDAIGRILPTRWEGSDIVVNDQVTMKGPGYKTEDCEARPGAPAGALNQVKKVIEAERKRLARDNNSGSGSNSGGGSNSGSGSKGPKPVVPAIPAIPAFTGGQRKGG